MTRDPLVSICVPTFNRAGYLRRSLPLICAQDYRPLEILISDNASTDETQQICREAALRDDRIRYVRQPKTIGLYSNYGNHNFCIRESRGEFLCFFHDDDQYQPDIVKHLAAFLSGHPEVGLVCSNWQLIDGEGRLLRSQKSFAKQVMPGMEYIDRTVRSGRSSVCIPGTLIRRSALGEARFDESGPIGFGDFVVWFTIAEKWAIGHVPEFLWSYREHQSSLSRQTIHYTMSDYSKALTHYFEEHLKRWPGHAEQVHRWQSALHRFLFWSLAYELCLHFQGESRKSERSAREVTRFERMSYRLTEAELQEVRASLRQHQRGAVQPAVRSLIEGMLRVHFTWPLTQMIRYPESLRVIFGMK